MNPALPRFVVAARVVETAPAVSPRTSAPGHAAPRDYALDFARGALVLCMVAYHAFNYFQHDVSVLRHLHFVPTSFIFLAGFLITRVYLPRSREGQPGVFRRLFVRGLKTLALFIALNLAVHAVFSTSYNRHLGLDVFFHSLEDVFLTGQQRAAVFGVLLPISYVLLISAVLLWVSRLWSHALPVVAGAVFLGCAWLGARDQLVFNLDLVSMGLLGLVAGFVSKPALQRLAQYLVVIVLAYAAYSIAIRTWYPTYLINTVGVALSLLLLYGVGQRLPRSALPTTAIALLGNYSLFAYLVQIAVLQVLFRASRAFGVLEFGVFLPLVLTAALTFAAVIVVGKVRLHSPRADRAYKAVFA